VDIGCASGYMSHELGKKGCKITGVDQYAPPGDPRVDTFIKHDLNTSDSRGFGIVRVRLAAGRHRASPFPRVFCRRAPACRKQAVETRVIVSTGMSRFRHPPHAARGAFHYGRGYLDLTHTRLFTFSTFRELFEQAGTRSRKCAAFPHRIHCTGR